MSCDEGKPDLEYTHTRPCGRCGRVLAAGTECVACHADGVAEGAMADMRLLRAALAALVASQTREQRQPLPLTIGKLCPACNGDVVVRRLWGSAVEIECAGCGRMVRT